MFCVFQLVYVMPSSSARCAHLPRAADKIPFYVGLRKLRDHVRGVLPTLQESEVCFSDIQLKSVPKVKIEPQYPPNNQFGHSVVNGHHHHNGAIVNGVLNDSTHIKDEPIVNGFGSENTVPKGTVHHIAMNSKPLQDDVQNLSSSPEMSGRHRTGTTSSANPNLTSQQRSTPVSNRQSMLSRTQEHVWTRPTLPAASSDVTMAESTAHIPCTSSTVLTSEWINKHFNNPPAQPVLLGGPWGVRADPPSIAAHSPWNGAAAAAHAHTFMNAAELPKDGYGSVPPSR